MQIQMLLQRSQKNLKHGCFTQIFKPAAQQIYIITTVSRCATSVSVTNSVSNLVWNVIPIAPWIPDLCHWIIARKVYLQSIMMSQWRWSLFNWMWNVITCQRILFLLLTDYHVSFLSFLFFFCLWQDGETSAGQQWGQSLAWRRSVGNSAYKHNSRSESWDIWWRPASMGL